jgi:phage FluMu protein Com
MLIQKIRAVFHNFRYAKSSVLLTPSEDSPQTEDLLVEEITESFHVSELVTGDTIQVIKPPSLFFETGEQLHVNGSNEHGVYVPKDGVNFLLGYESVEKVEKNWKKLRCPHCNSVLFEVDIKNYIPWSVRSKCRKCKITVIVRGVKVELQRGTDRSGDQSTQK